MLMEWTGNGWGPGPWFLFFPLLWLALIGGLVFVFRRNRRDDHVRAGESVLAERFARGEITEDEYRRRASVLKGRGR